MRRKLTGDFAALRLHLRHIVRDLAAAAAQIEILTQRMNALDSGTAGTRQGRLLHVAIADVFSESELNLLAHELDVEDGAVMGQLHEERCMNLVEYVRRRGQLSQLMRVLGQKRPSINWSEAL